MPTDALPPEIRRELDAIDAALAGRPVDPELTELGALAVALRDERPEPDPFFVRGLDSRAAAGFARPSRASRLKTLVRRSPMLVPGVAVSVLLALVVSVALLKGPSDLPSDFDSAGGGSSSSGASSAGDSAAAPESAPQAAEDSAGAGSAVTQSAGRAAKPTPSLAAPVPPVGGGGSPKSDKRTARKVERSASMTLVAKPGEVDSVADRIVQTADANGGFVVSSSVGTVEGGGGGDF